MNYNQNNNDFNFEFGEGNSPTHMSYKKYKKKVEPKKKNESLALFVGAFFVMLLIFLGLAKQLSPDIDVSIGNEGEESSSEGFFRGSVDSRLSDIQNEDKNPLVQPQEDEDELFDQDLEEKVVINLGKDENTQESVNNEIQEEPVRKPETKPVQKVQEEQVKNTSAPTPVSAPAKLTARVVVGYYATAEQAEVAKGILQEAGLNISPIVRNIGGAYTIQAGAFSTREAAQAAAQTLLRNNFPARVIVEQ